MSNKTFNIYCDESTHLPNDKKPYMLLGCVNVAYPASLGIYLQRI